MRDDIDTTTPATFIAAFGQRASTEFERRMARLARYVRDIGERAEALAAFRALVAMDGETRSATVGKVVDDVGGAASLGGAESLALFVNAAMVLERDYHAVPFVPTEAAKRQREAMLRSLFPRSPDRVAQRTAEWVAERERFIELREGPSPDGTSLLPNAILACIEANAREAARLEADRDAIRERARAARERAVLRLTA